MLPPLREFWLRLTTSRYTRSLEDEISRLRTENRALVNSILGIAGIPPLRLNAELARDRRIQTRATVGSGFSPTTSPSAAPVSSGDSDSANSHAAIADRADDSPDRNRRPNGIVLPVNPLRRRSWQQIGRMLEIEDARRLANRDNSDSMS